MMLKQKIRQDVETAFKAREQLKTETLRQLLASMTTKEKEKRFTLVKAKPDTKEDELQKQSELSDEEVGLVVFSEIKKRREAIEGFEKGGRQEMADKENQELEILQAYLPEQLGEDDIKKLVKEAVAKTGASGPQDMGKVMAELMPKVRGKADGSLVSRIVRENL